MSEYLVPAWLEAELSLNHAGIEIRWMPYEADRKVFVLPVTGDAFYRMPVKKMAGAVAYRRYLTPDSPPKWTLHPLTYFPDNDCVTSGRFVVFQTNVATGEIEKVFDCVNDDGTLHPLDRRIIAAIQLRDGKFGAHEKAIKDVEALHERGDAVAFAVYEDATADLFERIHHDISKAATHNACVTADPDEDDLEITHEDDLEA